MVKWPEVTDVAVRKGVLSHYRLNCSLTLLGLILLLGVAAKVLAQSGQGTGGVSNIRLTEQGGAAIICYDLEAGPISRVRLVGARGEVVLNIKTVTGDAGIVFGPAKDLCIQWNVSEDYPDGLQGEDISLDVVVEEYVQAQDDPPPVPPKAQDMQAFASCAKEKMDKHFQQERDILALAQSEYISHLNADQATWFDMMQKVKGGVPYVKRWDRDAYGKKIPIYDREPLPEREKAKLQRELDRQLEKAERSPESVISTETRRTREKQKEVVTRLFTRIADICERETGVDHAKAIDWMNRVYGPSMSPPEPFAFIKAGKDWE